MSRQLASPLLLLFVLWSVGILMSFLSADGRDTRELLGSSFDLQQQRSTGNPTWSSSVLCGQIRPSDNTLTSRRVWRLNSCTTLKKALMPEFWSQSGLMPVCINRHQGETLITSTCARSLPRWVCRFHVCISTWICGAPGSVCTTVSNYTPKAAFLMRVATRKKINKYINYKNDSRFITLRILSEIHTFRRSLSDAKVKNGALLAGLQGLHSWPRHGRLPLFQKCEDSRDVSGIVTDAEVLLEVHGFISGTELPTEEDKVSSFTVVSNWAEETLCCPLLAKHQTASNFIHICLYMFYMV